jgi:hypothetical protein
MMYDNRGKWVFGLSQSSGVLKSLKITMFRKLDLFPSSSEGTSTLLGPLEIANPNHWTTYIRKLQLYKYLRTEFINRR